MNQQLYSALNKSPNKAIAVHNPAEAEVKSAAGEAEQMHEYEESFEEEEEANSTVKSAGGEARKASDDAIGGQESAREIDNSKGDKSGEIVNCRANKSSEEANGPQARAIEGNVMDARETNSTIGSDIFAVFNQTDMEVSYISSGGDEARETSITYSNIGLFEQMIKTEKMKGDRLFKMIRTREKALIDRTRGQIAWLELQKKRFKEKGGILQISAIRKKQRAILLKLERERGELQRQMRSQPTSPTKKSPSHRVRVVEKTISNVVSLRRSPLPALENRGAVKGFEMAAGTTLEKLLEQREKELQKRREHVEFLLQWHQRLEREEKNVREMENKLLNSNLERIAEKQNLQALTDGNEEEEKSSEAMKRVEDIDKSLEILHNIVQESGSEADFVAVRGAKLNYLWKKLVGKEEEKFSPESVIKMTKEDFSQLYEDAKIRILREFDDEKKIRQLMDESVASVTRESNSQHSTEAEEEEEEEENTEKCEEQPFPGYSTDDFETVAESEKVVESGLEEAETNVVKSPEESFQEECSKNDQTEDQSHSEATRDSINREEALITAEESVKSEMNLISEAFSPEILSQAEEEQLISEITLPSFSDTTIADETIVEEEAEGLEESEQTEDRSDDIVVNSENSPNSHDGDAENGLDSDLSAHSKHENLDKTLNISQESLNTAQDVESVTLESFEDDEGGEEVQSELEKRIIQVDVSLKDLSSAMEKSPILEALSPRETSSSASTGSSNSSPEASVQSGEESRASTSSERLESVANGEDNSSQESSSRFIQENYAEVYPKSPDDSQGSGSFSQQKIRDYKIPNRMPDIISEAELLRRQQMQIEQEIKQLEQSVPAVFLREIPNKPPPPYVPPAQDSPLATIFPSEDRVMELVNDRTKELYFSVNSGKAIAESASDCSSITNVYEKIVVGMCEEIFGDINETLDTQYDAPFQRVRLYRNKLAFFNPPDRLACIQDHILESIARILPGLGSMPRQTLQLPANSRRKRDQIDEIVIEEMLEDDWKWSNFQIEETEVLDTMTETIFSTLLEDAIRDIDVAYTKKFPHNS
ncbi:centrosome-associated protein 350-like [Phlebotomus argentipes]|uniref:centrosome-associated protein 350-like n=1 Tax=Phlebotomus argentipes TaxID=94469 RepID=UPI002893615A|nr:centrosome-associated protein 350-like [Phlebotomus argentipes]